MFLEESEKGEGGLERISQRIERTTLKEETTEKVKELDAMLRGWGNYFSLGPVSKAYRAVDAHTRYRLRQWLRHKHQRKRTYPYEYLYEQLGLVRLEGTTSNLPWAKA